jgi:adenylate cyclase
MGDAVNKAFRLEDATKRVGRAVVVGDSTYRMMELTDLEPVAFTEHSVELKGYDEPEQAYGLGLEDLERVVQALRARADG